jgi:hypothetical protein
MWELYTRRRAFSGARRRRPVLVAARSMLRAPRRRARLADRRPQHAARLAPPRKARQTRPHPAPTPSQPHPPGISADLIKDLVRRNGARPRFPDASPTPFAALAAACWAADPGARPCIDEVVARLEGVAAELEAMSDARRAAAAAAATAAAAAAPPAAPPPAATAPGARGAGRASGAPRHRCSL